VAPCIIAVVATRERPRDRALRQAARIRRQTGGEIRTARQSAGLSLRAAAAAVGMDFGQFARIERDEAGDVRVSQLCLACEAVGLEFKGRPYAAGDPARDAAHLGLLARLRAQLPSSAPWRTEVPLPIVGDLRAVDAEALVERTWVGFEAETRIRDVQATERKAQLKKRDADLRRMFLVVADTKSNRAVLRAHREALRTSFPLDTREVLGALRVGRLPAADGIVII
jgi:transcriptional regulator with XRE-family HTH domain